MVRPKKAPPTTPKTLKPDPWSTKTKIKKRTDLVSEDDPIGT